MSANRIDQLIEKWAPVIKAAFLSAIKFIRDRIRIAFIAERLEKGDIDGAIKGAGLEPAAFREFDLAIGRAYESAGNFTSNSLPPKIEDTGHRLDVLFDARNPAAEEFLRGRSSDAVTAIIADQKVAIRAHLTAGLAAGNNPRTVALELAGRISPVTKRREGGVIGLTSSQEGWAQAYAGELAKNDPNALTRALRDKRFDKTVAKAIKDGKPLSADMQAKIVATYRNRALRFRAETISRTEMLTSLHVAQHESITQAIAAGKLNPAAVTQIWRTAGDSRVRDTHRALNGTSEKWGVPFVSPGGAILRFPGDPQAPAGEIINCRCWLELKVNYFLGVK